MFGENEKLFHRICWLVIEACIFSKIPRLMKNFLTIIEFLDILKSLINFWGLSQSLRVLKFWKSLGKFLKITCDRIKKLKTFIQFTKRENIIEIKIGQEWILVDHLNFKWESQLLPKIRGIHTAP